MTGGLDASSLYSPEQQQMMANINAALAALPGPQGALGSALPPPTFSSTPPAPSDGTGLGAAPTTGPGGSFQPPAMRTFAPNDPSQGPSYGWSFPSVPSVPASPSTPAPTGSTTGSGSGGTGGSTPGVPNPSSSGPHAGDHHRAAGGPAGSGTMPWYAKREAEEMFHPGGLIKSDVAGRTDRIPLSVAAGSYIIPADVVSGLGEGNTLAGAKVLDMIMHSGPHGTKNLPQGGGGMGPPSPPPAAKFARGGETGKKVKIVTAGGEYVVHPADVAKWSAKGDINEGHDALDGFVKRAREHIVKKTKALPGPKK